MAQLREYYNSEIVPALMQQFGFDNPMRVPRITKIVLNMGLGEAVADKKVLENATADLALISGQKPIVTKARKSIAGFKIREGWPIGCKVTLRGERMYEFVERLVGIAIPRIRDFRGLSPKSFDGRGNFAMGVNEQIIFPEIDYDKIDTIRGLDITIATTAQNDEEGRALLTALRFPFRGMGASDSEAVKDTAVEKESDKEPEQAAEESTAEPQQAAAEETAEQAPAEEAAGDDEQSEQDDASAEKQES